MDIQWHAHELDGLFAGQFEPKEYEHFIESGQLYKSYEGIGALLGLATLRLTKNKE